VKNFELSIGHIKQFLNNVVNNISMNLRFAGVRFLIEKRILKLPKQFNNPAHKYLNP